MKKNKKFIRRKKILFREHLFIFFNINKIDCGEKNIKLEKNKLIFSLIYN